MTISNVLLSLTLPLKHRIHSLLVPFSTFFSFWGFGPSIGSIALPWPLVMIFTETLFILLLASTLECSTAP